MARFPAFFEEVAGRVGIPLVTEPEPGEWAAPWVRERTVAAPDGDLTLVEVVPGSLTEDEGGNWPDQSLTDGERALWLNEGRVSGAVADAIAEYRPWHVHGAGWGIVVDQSNLLVFTEAIASLVGVPADQLAPHVLRDVLAHEYTHFAFEVAGTTLEDVLRRPLYSEYILTRYGVPNRWSSGPLEEVVATWAEQAFVEGPAPPGLKRPSRRFARAVAQVNSKAPAGYRDFELLRDPVRAERIIADVGAEIAQQPLWSGRWWPGVEDDERQQVPLTWRGDPTVAMLFGAFPKTLARPSIPQFERWVQGLGGVCRPGGKHWKVTLPNGRRCGYTKPADHLYLPEARRIAVALGLANARELYVHIGDGSYPKALVSA